MNINFKTLFDVDIFHEYYKDGISKDCLITPSDECKKHLQNYRLIFHPTNSGFNVSYQADNYDSPIIQIDSLIKLTFILIPQNPYLLNYSNLPIDKIKNTVYYLSNFYLEYSAEKNLLQESEFLSEKDRIDLKSEFFSLQVSSSKDKVNATILDISDYPVINKDFRTNNNVADIQVDLRPYAPGKFTLLIDNNEESKFYADNSLLGKSVFGVIEIFLDSESEIPQAFEISIPRRKTYWKYNVMLKHSTGLSAEDISIDIPKTETDKLSYTFTDDLIKNKDIEPKILFDRLPGIESSDSPTCIPFVFSKELPLKEETIQGIRLVKINNNGNGESDYGNPVIENLSNPQISSIKPEKDTGKVYSEVNVYI